MATAEQLRQDYYEKFGSTVESALQNPIEYYKVPRPDIYKWLQEHPEVYEVIGRTRPASVVYTEGGQEVWYGGEMIEESKPQQIQQMQQVTQAGVTTYYMETPTGRVSISPEEYGKIAKEHIMGSRMNVFASVPPKTERQLQIEERRRDPWFQRVFFTEKAMTGQATTAIIEWIFAKDKKKFSQTQASQWRVEQTQILTKLGEGKRAEVTFERTAPVALAATMILVSPVLGKAMGPTLTAGIGGGLVGIGTYFAASGWKPVVEYSQPSTLGAGIVMIGAGSLMVKSGWEAAFPRPPPDVKVEVMQRGGAMQRVQPDMKEFTGVKKSEMFGKAGERKFIASSYSDYGATIGKRDVVGFGQVDTQVKEIVRPSFWQAAKARITGEKLGPQFGEIVSQKHFFKTIGIDLGDDFIFSQTIHVEAKGSNLYNIYLRTGASKELAKTGIDLTLMSAGKELKGFVTTTKITEWLIDPPKLPSKTVSYLTGEKLLGADITDIGYVMLQGPSSASTTTGGVSTKVTSESLFTGIAEVSAGIGKSATKDIIKGMTISPPELAKTYAFALSKPSVKTDTGTLVKTDMLTGLRTAPKTKTATRMDTELGTRMDTGLASRMDIRSMFRTGTMIGGMTAMRMDTQLGQKLDTGLALKLDTQISMPSMMSPLTPISPIPIGFTGAILGGIGFGKSDIFRKKKRKTKRLRKKTRPQPSLGGIVLRKKGKLKKMFTGIEPVRPLGKRKRKRWL